MRKLIDQWLNDHDNPRHKKVVSWMWRLLIGGILAVFLLFFGLSLTDLPSVAELENPETNVYDIRLVKHEDGYMYGIFCVERKDETKLTFGKSSSASLAGNNAHGNDRPANSIILQSQVMTCTLVATNDTFQLSTSAPWQHLSP